MRRYLIFAYAILGYLLSMVSLTFLILWVYPWSFMEYYIDRSMVSLDIHPIVVDIALVILFGLQHSIMARSFFKEKLWGKLSDAVKSATYSLASSICLVLIFYFWQPIDGYLWDFQDGTLYWVMSIIYIAGWLIAFVSTFIIDHFELFGLHQGYRVFRGASVPISQFQTRFLYKHVRHPIQAGTIIGIWATPTMSYTHLLFSISMTAYILIGLHFEEKSLVATFGEKYRDYIGNTPILVPRFTKD